jgi:hypothetical protein
MTQTSAPASRTAALAADFRILLAADGLHDALRMLNASAPYRFTGVYSFEPGWVRSHTLFDRENPELRVGADVPMKESYCMFTARASGEPIIIENAPEDLRWAAHAARDSVLSYVAVLLLDPEGNPIGTLCHFDFQRQELPSDTLEILAAVRDPVQEHLWELGVRAHPDTDFF